MLALAPMTAPYAKYSGGWNVIGFERAVFVTVYYMLRIAIVLFLRLLPV